MGAEPFDNDACQAVPQQRQQRTGSQRRQREAFMRVRVVFDHQLYEKVPPLEEGAASRRAAMTVAAQPQNGLRNYLTIVMPCRNRMLSKVLLSVLLLKLVIGGTLVGYSMVAPLATLILGMAIQTVLPSSPLAST